MKRSNQMKKFVMSVAAGGLLAFASVAQAGEPVQLSDVQLDQVSAGATSAAQAIGVAFGNFGTATQSQTAATADAFLQQATSAAANLSVASSVLGLGAAAQSQAQSAATLP
jgi:hypothetical protein